MAMCGHVSADGATCTDQTSPLAQLKLRLPLSTCFLEIGAVRGRSTARCWAVGQCSHHIGNVGRAQGLQVSSHLAVRHRQRRELRHPCEGGDNVHDADAAGLGVWAGAGLQSGAGG